MKVTEPEVSQRYAALYQATIDHAVGGAPDLMARLVAHTRAALRDLESRAPDRRERDHLTGSRRQLNQHEAIAVERFSEELKTAFARVASRERALPAQPASDAAAGLNPAQVRQSVETARVRHAVQIAADHALAELNQLICAMLGLEEVQLERNPLRPAVYVDAVTAALSHLPVPSVVRQGWISLMSGALGQELDVYYRQLCTDLRERGVGAPGARAADPVAPGGPAAGEAAMGRDTQTLTLERLRQLLAQSPAVEKSELWAEYQRPADEIARPGPEPVPEAGPTGFRPTMPAAFEAARDMKQLDRVARRIEGRHGDAAPEPMPAARAQQLEAAHGLEQTLSLEVVALMVDAIRHDGRLLGPVQDLVGQLEPALLQLALVDPRFFTHKLHPARRLLHEITHRSIAYESVDSRGFSGFMEPLREAVAPLAAGTIDSAEPFDQALARLAAVWGEPAGTEKRQIAKAVQALQQAEQRSALAAIMVREVLARPDAVLVPSVVLDFLCGPWAQVVAHARMTDRSGADDPGQYAGLIDELMWSAQPELTRQDVPALTRMVPGLMRRLYEGLSLIGFSRDKTGAFFEVLDDLHQRGFDALAFAETVMSEPEARDMADGVSRWNAADSAWLVPAEAQASGFLELALEAPVGAAPALAGKLVTGVWVALLAEGSWTRTRLAWTSPNGSLLLFTDALGFMHSLTSRACEQLYAGGQLRIISTDPVGDALDAVARAAMRDSVDVRF